MSDGTLSVRRRQPKASEASAADGPFSAASLRAGTFESFLGGTIPNLGQLQIKDKTKARPVGDVDEFKVETKRRKRLKEYDRLLKTFKYSAALDSVLRKVRLLALPFLLVAGIQLMRKFSLVANPTDDDVRSYPRAYPP